MAPLVTAPLRAAIFLLAQWYKYDLEYWGLDYPPLPAHHSLLLGWIAGSIIDHTFQASFEP
ncbi:hypothetical protein BJ742DRAFT_822693 [Cladochytrium replicatum]|nr:hypothetical protein BJ742DRAFT_822693 [Cladochytrium replicatum]